jgi:hypothetical protein
VGSLHYGQKETVYLSTEQGTNIRIEDSIVPANQDDVLLQIVPRVGSWNDIYIMLPRSSSLQ